MSDGSLSQSEIDALLSGTTDLLGDGGDVGGGGDDPFAALMGGLDGGSTTPSAPTTRTSVKSSKDSMAPVDPNNLELLLDVNMKLTVELGRTKMSIKEILHIGEGAVIELDKLHGEPVDILVNDKVIARGEIIVVNEDFGIRVVEILASKEMWPGFMKK